MSDEPENELPALSLSEARSRIDEIDQSIQSLISERARWARAVGRAKGPLKAALDYYRPEREAQVLRGVLRRHQGPLSEAEMLRLFREIMSACLAQQQPLKIAYLGPAGTFSQQAVLKHFGHSVHELPLPTIEEVFAEVAAAHADFGVVPVENSSEGAVNNTQDMFLSSDLKICGEIELAIHQHLLSRAVDLKQIERVYSHPQSLAQCKTWLRNNLAHAERIPVGSNAEAARRAGKAEDAAAIAGSSAAHVYNVPILRPNIEDRPDNTTRFLVLGREIFSPSEQDKTSLLLTVRDKPGVLQQLLDPLARMGINMTRIESRPSRTGRWEYVFFIDIEGHIEDPRVQAALGELGPEAAALKVLGSYPVAVL